MMTKKDYNLIANILREALVIDPELPYGHVFDHIYTELCALFAAGNERFDKNRFHIAVFGEPA